MLEQILTQVVFALLYYVVLVLLLRLAGKRLAGQTTTFDLIVLISLGVVLQTTALKPGALNAVVFVVTVFALHRTLALACARSTKLRHFMRGTPSVLVREGRVVYTTLDEEAMSYEELLAGLRKLGHESPNTVKLAILEETGHITAVPLDPPQPPREVHA